MKWLTKLFASKKVEGPLVEDADGTVKLTKEQAAAAEKAAEENLNFEEKIKTLEDAKSASDNAKTTAETAKTTAENNLQFANTTLANLNKELGLEGNATEAQMVEKIKSLNALPGSKGTKIQVKKEEFSSEQVAANEAIDNMPHNKAADEFTVNHIVKSEKINEN
ncbi:MAG: hypothetical protein ACKVPJ_13530 [Chitinophagales bacterium]